MGETQEHTDERSAFAGLLDEAPAHLDESRRAALFDEIEALGLQAFMTGTERSLFAALEGRAQFVSVEGGALLSPSPLEGEGGGRSLTDEG